MPGKELALAASLANEFKYRYEELQSVMDLINLHMDVMNKRMVGFIDEVRTTTRGTTHAAEDLASKVLVIKHNAEALLPPKPPPPLEVSSSDVTAMALRYEEDASSSMRSQAGRPGAPPEQQCCKTCHFAQASDGTRCPCLLFKGKTVNCEGWCESWTLKVEKRNEQHAREQ